MFLLAKSKYLSGSQSNCVFLFKVNNFCAFKSLTFSNDQYILIDENKYKKAHTLKHHHKQSFPPSCPPQAWFSVSPVKLNTISILGFFWSALTCEFGCLISDQRHVRSYDHFRNNIIHKMKVLEVAGKPL